MMTLRRTLALASATVISLATSGCISTDSTGLASATVEGTTFDSSLGVDLAASTRTVDGAYIRDISVGTGPLVTNGQTLNVKYTGWLADGTEFDSNETLSTNYVFILGNGDVIPGWDEGIPGMHVGGKRQLVLPPTLGYGAYGYGPIPGNAVIVFNIEIISAQ